MKKTAGELAKIVGGTLYGDPAVVIDDVRSAESAGCLLYTSDAADEL